MHVLDGPAIGPEGALSARLRCNVLPCTAIYCVRSAGRDRSARPRSRPSAPSVACCRACQIHGQYSTRYTPGRRASRPVAAGPPEISRRVGNCGCYARSGLVRGTCWRRTSWQGPANSSTSLALACSVTSDRMTPTQDFSPLPSCPQRSAVSPVRPLW